MLSTTAATLLALLEPEPAHGYTLKHHHDRYFSQQRPIAFGQVYASLSRFDRDGLAELVEVQSGDGPDRRLYRITPDGVARIDEWVATPQDPGLFATSTLFARVTVALLSERSADDVLVAQRAQHMQRMRSLQKQRPGLIGAELLSVTYELAHLDADLRWIEDSGQRLEQLRAELEETQC